MFLLLLFDSPHAWHANARNASLPRLMTTWIPSFINVNLSHVHKLDKNISNNNNIGSNIHIVDIYS